MEWVLLIPKMIKNLDLKKYSQLSKKIFIKNKKIKIIFEPGRMIIVANVGILISKILYIKNTD